MFGKFITRPYNPVTEIEGLKTKVSNLLATLKVIEQQCLSETNEHDKLRQLADIAHFAIARNELDETNP